MFLRKIFVKNTLGTIESKNHHKNKNRSDFTGWFLFKKFNKMLFESEVYWDILYKE